MLEGSHCFLGINQCNREVMCVAQGHNPATVASEPRNSGWQSNAQPLCSLNSSRYILINEPLHEKANDLGF